MTHTPIVVGFDGSACSRGALEWALDEARVRNAPIEVVYALIPTAATLPPGHGFSVPDEDIQMKEADIILSEGKSFAALTAPSVEVTTGVTRDSAVEALLKRGENADLVAVGSRGLGSFVELLLGSTSFQLASHAKSPTIVVRPTSKESEGGQEAGRIVVGIDGSRVSEIALAFALQEASLRGVGLTILAAWDIPYLDLTGGRVGAMPRDIIDTEDQEVRTMLAEIAAGSQERYPDVDIRREVVAGKAVQVLVEASRGAEMLVVGSRGRGGFRSLLLGSVSHGVLHHAQCTTAVVRG